MQRARPVEREVVGDVHQRIDRAKADVLQALLHPIGARAILHATHEAQGEGGREMLVLGREVERDRHRARELGICRLDRMVLELAKTRRREIARDAMDARRIGTVGRQIDLDDRLVETGEIHIALAHRRIGGKLDDAVMVVGEFQFRRRAEHAVRFNAADHALAERDLLGGNVGARCREHALEASSRIGRATDDLHGRWATRIDHADAQAVRIGMRIGLDYVGNDEVLQLFSRIFDMLDLKADARQRLDDLV